MNYTSHSESDTLKIGFDLAKELKKGDIVAFYGDLGVGKTAFIRGIAKYFGISETASPTFTIVNEYNGTETLYHFDAYRITADDWLACDFDEYLFGNGICLIEWAENIESILPEGTIRVRISKNTNIDYDYRDIEVEK